MTEDNWLNSFLRSHGVKVALTVVVLAMAAIILITGYGLPWGSDAGDLGTQHCQAEFGDDAEYSGYLGGNPPILICEVHGEAAYMDMPESMADKLNINATAYNDDS